MPQMLDMAFLGAEISENQAETPEGFLLCLNVPIARTGVQKYYGHEIGLDSADPNYSKVVKVYRLAEDVMNSAAVKSFEGKPFTNDHPAETVTPQNYTVYDKGHLQNLRASGHHVVADIMAKESNVISLIRSKQKRQVSAGYFCDYVPYKDGYRQVNIRGNHLALVDKGRAGPKVCINDSVLESKKGAKSTMAMTKKQAQKKALHILAQSVTDADEFVELTEMLSLDASAVEIPPVKPEGKKAENGLMKALLGTLFSKDEDDDESGKEGDDESKKTEDALNKRIDKLESTMDAILVALKGKAADSDDDEEDDEKPKTEDSDSGDDDEDWSDEDKQKAQDEALKAVIDEMKPFIKVLPEAKQKEAKDALRKQLKKGDTATNVYAAIAAGAKKKPVNDADAIDYHALATDIMQRNNAQNRK